MQAYAEPILFAIIAFPVVALVFTLPYMIVQYRRHGSIPLMRTVIVYSFIFYLMCADLLTILPLQDIETVRAMTRPYTQLVPFMWVADAVRSSGFSASQPSTWLRMLTGKELFQFIANIAMFLPFGIYLRYYFRWSFKRTLIASFLLSLFFELTQLSGLFFIYPRPYRLADVDDLIANTLGGCLGYAIAPVVTAFLPSRDRLDEISDRRGKRVPLLRRTMAFLIDATLAQTAAWLLRGALPQSLPVSETLYDMLAFLGFLSMMTWLMGGRTPGRRLLRLRLEDARGGGRPRLWQCALHVVILYIAAFRASTEAVRLLSAQTLPAWRLALAVTMVAVAAAFWFVALLRAIMNDRQLLHCRFSRTREVSVIHVRTA